MLFNQVSLKNNPKFVCTERLGEAAGKMNWVDPKVHPTEWIVTKFRSNFGAAATPNASNCDKMVFRCTPNLVVKVNCDKMEVGLWGGVASDPVNCSELHLHPMQWITVHCSCISDAVNYVTTWLDRARQPIMDQSGRKKIEKGRKIWTFIFFVRWKF